MACNGLEAQCRRWPHLAGGFGLRTPNAPPSPAAARPRTWGRAPASHTGWSPAGATAPAVRPPALQGATIVETVGEATSANPPAAGIASVVGSPPSRGSICHRDPEACTAIGDRPLTLPVPLLLRNAHHLVASSKSGPPSGISFASVWPIP